MEALTAEILPELMQSRKRGEKHLRIWSAGCSGGEEPYSIAIALREWIPDPEAWNITILATDVNPRILRKGRAGTFGEWSFRDPPAWLKRKYFRQREDGRYEIDPVIRGMVSFGFLNLAEDKYPSLLTNTNAMDVIFCRNVMMYFSADHAMRVARNFFSSLVDGGWLIVSASELSGQLFAQFSTVRFPNAVFYRKSAEAGAASLMREHPSVIPMRSPMPLSPCDTRTSAMETVPVLSRPAPVPAVSAIPADAEPLPQETPAQLIRTLANQGKLDEAIARCLDAITNNKLDPALHFLHATILQEQHKEDEAVAALKRAIYIDMNHILSHFTLGNILLRQGNSRGARKSFENVLEILKTHEDEEILPDADGLTAGRLGNIVRALMQAKDAILKREEGARTRVHKTGDH